jgi:hypothetical protein
MRVRRQIGTSLLLAICAIGIAGAAPAVAAAQGPGASAEKALHRAQRLLDVPRHRTGPRQHPQELTTTLLTLSRSLDRLGPVQRRNAKALLARPTDSPDPDGSAYTTAEHSPPFCSTHFCVHYVTTTADAPALTDDNHNGVPDYVEQVDAVAETVYNVENGTLGWRAPKPDGTRGGDARIDIYLVQLGGQLFGYSATDLGQHGRSQAGYLVLDNDYSAAEFPGTTPLNDLEVTLAHEYNHVLQFGYDAAQDVWFDESTAVWMEDHVFPDVNDYLRYLPPWDAHSKVPLTTNNIKIYGSGVFNHWLAGRYGDAIIRNIWERSIKAKPAGFAIGAYNLALRRAKPLVKGVGVQDFSHEFASFAAATAEWRTPGVFPYPDAPTWGDVKRDGSLSTHHFLVRRISHTGFVLLNVKPRNVKAIRLLAGARRSTKSAFGLICRQGPVESGSVRTKLRFARHGGVRGVTLRDPGKCTRITAVLVNADARQHGFAFGDWVYPHDHEPFAATLVVKR